MARISKGRTIKGFVTGVKLVATFQFVFIVFASFGSILETLEYQEATLDGKKLVEI